MDVNQYKKTHRKKETFVKGKLGEPPLHDQRQIPLLFYPVYERSTSTLSYPLPTYI